jgi:hypothetical protein
MLMKIAQDANLSDHFHLRSAVVNNDLIFDSQSLGNGTAPTLGDQQFASEVINYVILQTASESITTGEPADYSMIARLRGNACFWANPFDSMANNLFTNTQSGFNPEPSMTTGLQPETLNQEPKPAGKGNIFQRMGHLMKRIAKGIWDHRGAIMNGIEMIPLLADSKPIGYP